MTTKQVDEQKPINELNRPNIFGVRHFQAILFFTGISTGYFLRVNMSAAIVPMTQPTGGDHPYYDWDTSTKSLILSSFFWGYVVIQVPAGILSKMFGAKLVLGIATIIASVLTIFHPLAIGDGSWIVLCILRVIMGLTQGVVYPCLHTLLAKWAPCTERSFITTVVYSGAQFGTVIILSTSGVIFDSKMGWPGIFYISGGVTLLWSIIFLYYGADSPADAKNISEIEREYIESLTGSDKQSHDLPIPWKAFFTSLPFYGLIAAHCGFVFGFYMLLTQIPTYLNSVLHYDMKSNGLLSALPYFVMWILGFVVSPISDMLINRNIITVTTARKLFNTIGEWVPMICLIGLGYMTEDEKIFAITLLTIGVGFKAAAMSGYLVNHMDLSPNFAGPMMGITNGISTICSICAPLVVGAVIIDEQDPSYWRIVFFITAGVYLVGNLLFLLIGQATVQPWNN